MTTDLVKALAGVSGDVYYRPYSPTDTIITAGLPPIKVNGWEYIKAWYNKPQSKRMPHLAGSGVFVKNRNGSGIIEIGLLQGVASGGVLELFDIVGIPIPIVVVDKGSSSTSGLIATACKRIETPQWSRGKNLEIIPYTFECSRLVISWGLQSVDNVT